MNADKQLKSDDQQTSLEGSSRVPDDGLIALPPEDEANKDGVNVTVTPGMPQGMNDGGPAFPHPDCTFVEPHDFGMRETIVRDHRGMSLRDWFAGQVIAGSWDDCGQPGDPLTIAKRAYSLADAMLAGR